MSAFKPACVIVFCLLLSLVLRAQKDSSLTSHHLLILPVIARSIETNWSFGAVASYTFHLSGRDSLTRTSNMQALGLYSLNKQILLVLNGSIYFPGERFILNQQISYSYFPDKFWGLGKIAPSENEEPYSFRQFYIYLHPQRRVGKNFFLGLVYEFQDVIELNYIQGGLFDQENVPGRHGYHVSGLGASISYDSRNNAFSPDKGVMLEFSFNHFAPVFGSGYQYTNFVIDLRKYIHVYKNQVLALQAYGYFNAGEVPVRSLASIGGANSMRGYYNGRFRDKDLAVIQGEYRAPLFGRLGAVVFGDFGNVGAELKELDFNHIKYSWGGGLRFALNRSERLNLRLDYGVGRGKSHGFYFQLGEAF